MTTDKPSLPGKPSSDIDVNRFLNRANTLPQRLDASPGGSKRMIFAMDATASRQPSWDRACQLQGQMFAATDKLGGIQVQLCYYRGFHEFHYSPWYSDTQSLLKTMTAVQCLGGYTQIERVLNHCTEQHKAGPVKAAVLIGDAVEENVDALCAKAGSLGMLGVPLFMFQEGNDPGVRHCFEQMAQLSKGAYATFDEHSASHLAELLAAAATFASAGLDALAQMRSPAARQLLQQLKG